MARENAARTIPAWLDEELVENEQSYRWLKCGDVKEKQKVK
jgi:hypothetical protein